MHPREKDKLLVYLFVCIKILEGGNYSITPKLIFSSLPNEKD